jgi:hypothetical protein
MQWFVTLVLCLALLISLWFARVGRIAARAQVASMCDVASDLRAQNDALRADLTRAQEQRDRLYWLEWWMRCACEAPASDPARPLMIRWALAAHLASDLRQLHCDMQRIQKDPTRTQRERVYAQAFTQEMDLRERGTTPWEQWALQPAVQGRPLHNPDVLHAAYRAALESWDALLASAPSEGGIIRH